MIENPDFFKVVEANFPKDAKLVMGCQVGMRSQKAAEILVQGGFGGMKDESGRTLAQGWAELGLPVSADNADGVSYESLAAKTGG
jgi:rhodanese-related sulfurtransferase